MTAELSYFRTVAANGQIARAPRGAAVGGSQSLAITSTPQEMVAAPAGSLVLCLQGTEALRYEYNTAGLNSAVATSHYLPAGAQLWLDVESAKVISVRTA